MLLYVELMRDAEEFYEEKQNSQCCISNSLEIAGLAVVWRTEFGKVKN